MNTNTVYFSAPSRVKDALYEYFASAEHPLIKSVVEGEKSYGRKARRDLRAFALRKDLSEEEAIKRVASVLDEIIEEIGLSDQRGEIKLQRESDLPIV